MKEEEIDKIFREALAGQKPPTTETDWEAFEGLLNSRRGLKWKWSVLTVLFLIASGIIGAYFLVLNPQPQYISRDQSNFKHLDKQKTEEAGITLFQEKETIESANSPVWENSNLQKPQRKSEIGLMSEIDQNSESWEVAKKDTGTKKRLPKNDQLSGTNLLPNIKAEENKKLSSSRTDILINTSSSANTSHGYGLSGDLVIHTNGDSLSMNNSTIVLESSLSSDSETNASIEVNERKQEMIPVIGTNVNTSILGSLKGEMRKVEAIPSPYFIPFVYFNLEQNTVFKSTPTIGIGLRRNFSFKSKGSMSFRIAIGYSRTGNLGWEQSNQTVVYGFDRYVEESNLRTVHLGLVQMPLRLSYHTGVHRFFVGTAMYWVVNGSQEYRQVPEGPLEKGYLFDSGAPKSALFFQLGYGFALSEKVQIDLGFNSAGSTWDPENKRPIGGFIQLNYFMR